MPVNLPVKCAWMWILLVVIFSQLLWESIHARAPGSRFYMLLIEFWTGTGNDAADMRSATWTQLMAIKPYRRQKIWVLEVPYALVMGRKWQRCGKSGLEWIEAQVKRLADLSKNLLGDAGSGSVGFGKSTMYKLSQHIQIIGIMATSCKSCRLKLSIAGFPWYGTRWWISRLPVRIKHWVSPHYYNTEDEIRRFAGEVLRREFPR